MRTIWYVWGRFDQKMRTKWPKWGRLVWGRFVLRTIWPGTVTSITNTLFFLNCVLLYNIRLTFWIYTVFASCKRQKYVLGPLLTHWPDSSLILINNWSHNYTWKVVHCAFKFSRGIHITFFFKYSHACLRPSVHLRYHFLSPLEAKSRYTGDAKAVCRSVCPSITACRLLHVGRRDLA